MSIRVLALAAILAALGATSALAATVKLNVVGGQLLGASNVPVDGTLYDVEFVDTSCVAAFDGCDSSSDFAFSTLAQAMAAAQSLLDFVLVDGPLGNFDSNPSLTAGIEAIGPNYGDFLIPYAPFEDPHVPGFKQYEYAVAVNNPGTRRDGTSNFSIAAKYDLSGSEWETLARFTPSQVAAVPLPAAGLLLLAGLSGLAALRARRRPAATG